MFRLAPSTSSRGVGLPWKPSAGFRLVALKAEILMFDGSISAALARVEHLPPWVSKLEVLRRRLERAAFG